MSEQPVAELICIGCPRGCPLKVTPLEGGKLQVEGASCKRGHAYARTEFTDPRRTLTTCVRVRSGELARVPVRSDLPLPRACLASVLCQLREITLDAPIAMHQVVLAQAGGQPIAVIATRPVRRAGNTVREAALG